MNIKCKRESGASLGIAGDMDNREMTWSVPTKSVTKIELVFKKSPETKGSTIRWPAMVADLKIHYSNIN